MTQPQPTSDILDRHEDAAVCTQPFRLFGRTRTAVGSIRTVRCFEDNALLKSILAQTSPGEILVVDGGNSPRTALMGDQIASMALANGWAGAIFFGSIRDSAALDAMAFHVKALGTVPRKSAKTGTGETGVVLTCGGIAFTPAISSTATTTASSSCPRSNPCTPCSRPALWSRPWGVSPDRQP